MVENDQNSSPDLKKIRERLESFLNYPRNEISLKDIEKIIINKLGCQREKSRKGSSVKYSHPLLEKCPEFTCGIFCIHIIHGRSKSNPMIRRYDYKKFLWRPLEIVLRKMEEGE